MRLRQLTVALATLALSLLPGCVTAGEIALEGEAIQGGLMRGTAQPGSTITLDGKAVRQAPDGGFIIGFGRDQGPDVTLAVSTGGQREEKHLKVKQRTYAIQRIDGMPPAMVTPPPEVLDRIKREQAAVKAARETDSDLLNFREAFRWPAEGRVTGVYGSQRILNGEPRQPHFGIDIAAPEGTPVQEVAGGRVLMAEPDLYYTGGTVIVDHGYGIVSVYSHLKTIDVKVGQAINQGDPIGTIGRTGRATGAHLDWRVSWFDVRLDPALLLPPRADMPIPAAPPGGE